MSIYANACGGYAIPGPQGETGPGVPAEGAMMSLFGEVPTVPPNTLTSVIPLAADFTFGTATTDLNSINIAVTGIYRVEAGVVWQPGLLVSDNSDRQLYCVIGSEVVESNVASGSVWPTTTTIARSMYVEAGETIGAMQARHSSSDDLEITSSWLNAFLIIGQDDLPGS